MIVLQFKKLRTQQYSQPVKKSSNLFLFSALLRSKIANCQRNLPRNPIVFSKLGKLSTPTTAFTQDSRPIIEDNEATTEDNKAFSRSSSTIPGSASLDLGPSPALELTHALEPALAIRYLEVNLQ